MTFTNASMQIRILKRPSQNKKLFYFSFEWGKEKGERIATGIFNYRRPANDLQRHHNNEALAILKAKRSQLILSHQASNSGYFLQHKLKSNFFDYNEDLVKNSTIILTTGLILCKACCER